MTIFSYYFVIRPVPIPPRTLQFTPQIRYKRCRKVTTFFYTFFDGKVRRIFFKHRLDYPNIPCRAILKLPYNKSNFLLISWGDLFFKNSFGIRGEKAKGVVEIT